ncbi:beta-N-acetylhexosaminidase [Gelidibacter salicanalis]|uniref:beta-N-acetylhexosaminidase n=1 Tax=Gelidibacter salicanalis TaxID=291193 RepID=A0A934KU84_9FLAO|nr:beta-N-acetylhexosaminidase [Gelidibacter salicanalis]MBJ7882125.1 beta-N-acetylhexosaminidase [Gelidibacter salicanalis]
MKISLALIISILFFACNNPNKDYQNATSDYQIIPKPESLEMQTGRFVVDSKTTVSAAAGLEHEGDYLADMLSLLTNATIDFESGTSGTIQLKIDDAIENEEGYEVSVTYDNIVISGKTSKGVFYGIQTLRQLIPVSSNSETQQTSDLTIPAVEIKDHPRFAYRGMHLDVARHMFPVAFIKKYIDLLAMHKMNTFHWHLTEDQGWRIEIKKYPKLTEIGSKRYGTIIGHHPGTGNDETEYSGFYTQEEVKDIVKYATERHVTVIPEIELPGHASAAIAAYPFLSCFPEEPTIVTKDMGSKAGKEAQANGTPKIVQETWGVFDDVFCAGDEQTFQFLEDVLAEVIPLFPSEYIHIGGDECPKSNWKRCPDCQKRIKDNNLADEHELQSYFIQRIEKYLNANGKKIIGWDEILEGGLAPNATVMSWRGEKGGIEAAKQHHDVIMTPGHSCYFDHYQTEDKDNEPLAIGGKTTVADVYAYEPVPNELSEEESSYVLGAQGNVWTEYMDTTDDVEYMILPRMTALSEVVWTQKEARNWDDFKLRLNTMKHRYDAMDLNYAKHVFESKKDTLQQTKP